jgi:hypothetical protein
MTLIFFTSATHDTSVTPMTCVTLCHNVQLGEKSLKMQKYTIFQLRIKLDVTHFDTLTCL